METRWLPGANNAKQYGRWAFAEFTDVYAVQKDFGDKVQAQFDAMVKAHLGAASHQRHAAAQGLTGRQPWLNTVCII